ncbi:ATP-grasp domain-containing protein [Phenylobacterium sp.]|jgi:carbamoyl-phosphate synthase large subunit|uniref:ATP-grasp domain-containing protein n=1 Tax=Phenylobacterium sp. TaxID=1871053 RepID=UPI003782FE2B
MAVLILSAAAKVLLVRAFRDAAAVRGWPVIAADIAVDSAALFEADQALILPRSDDPAFAPALLDVCRRHAIRLVVPSRDGELAVLADLKPQLAQLSGVVLVPSAEALAICRDKRRFVEFCRAQGFETPRTFADGEPPQFPVFVRPAEGSGGAGARRVDRPQDLPDRTGLLVQALETAPEFTVDVLCSLDGRPLQAVARRRIAVRTGEAVKSQVVDAPDLTNPALRLASALGLIGHNVVQAFWETGRPPRFIEVNPRFGGASNLAIRAGLASPERILAMLAGEADRPRDIAYGLTMLRYAEDRLVTEAELAAIGR